MNQDSAPQNESLQRDSDETLARREKYRRLLSQGAEPYGRRFERTGSVADTLKNFAEGTKVSLAGRIMALRKQGKAIFMDLKDATGKIQVYLHFEKLGAEAFEFAKDLNLGDIAGLRGELFRTRTGMETVMADSITLLSKSIRPLPEKWHGLKDVETIYRQRYLDLVTNDESRRRFEQRCRIVSCIRRFLHETGSVEVETPMLHPLCGGAAANPFKTFYEVLGADFYLRIAPELYLKRLLVGGYERIFEINRSFRNEGLSRRHNPEFTMLEVYWAYEDYQTMMTLTEDIITTCAREVLGTLEIKVGEKTLSLEKPWRRLTFHDAVREHAGFDITGLSPADIAKRLHVEYDPKSTPDEILVAVFETVVEHRLTGPVFITDYPASVCPLSKTRRDNPDIAERFELYINGFEVANAYSELNDPFIQREKFEAQVRQHPSAEARVDEDYVVALEHAMPPAGGLGIGIDRLVMLLTGADSIRDVILFPQLKNPGPA